MIIFASNSESFITLAHDSNIAQKPVSSDVTVETLLVFNHLDEQVFERAKKHTEVPVCFYYHI